MVVTLLADRQDKSLPSYFQNVELQENVASALMFSTVLTKAKVKAKKLKDLPRRLVELAKNPANRGMQIYCFRVIYEKLMSTYSCQFNGATVTDTYKFIMRQYSIFSFGLQLCPRILRLLFPTNLDLCIFS